MRFKAAVFDLDGTILDSMDIWNMIDIEFLGKRGFEVPSDYMEKINALTPYETAVYTIERFGLSDTPEELMEEWFNMAVYEYSHNVRLFPYVREYMDMLKAKGIHLAAATSMARGLLDPCLSNLGLDRVFEAVCSVDDGIRGKSYPDIYLRAAELLGVKPEECIMFEDILRPIMSAGEAGMITCGVYEKFSAGEEQRLREAADMYIYDFSQAPVPEFELWDLYDENKKRVPGYVFRRDELPENCYHLTVNVWIQNDRGEFLISKRNPDLKDGLCWECTRGCAVSGEDSLAAALREVKEELGIELDKDRGRLLEVIKNTEKRFFADVWLFNCNVNKKELKLCESEVTEAKWASREELEILSDSGLLKPALTDYEFLIK